MKNFAQALVKQGDAHIRNFGIESFHLEAAELLKASDFIHHFDQKNVMNLSLEPDFMVPQNYPSFEFSDFPITLARGEDCFIDIYFWRRRPTVIHNHHFAGAFMCLEGLNVDLEYEFYPERKWGHFHQWGKLELRKEFILKKGDVSPIALLDGYIHQNHHQSDLTVNLCFRTNWIKGETLSHYFHPGLRSEKNPHLLSRFARIMGMIKMGEAPNWDHLDLDDAVYFILQNSNLHSGNPLLFQSLRIMHEKVLSQTGHDLTGVLKNHWNKMNEIEENYL